MKSILQLSVPTSRRLHHSLNNQAARTLRNSPQRLLSSSSSYSSSNSNSNSYSHSYSQSSQSKSSSGDGWKLLLASPSLLVIPEILSSDEVDKENTYPPHLLPPTPSVNIKESNSDRLFSPYSLARETRLSVGVSIIPHPAKRDKGGEDAYFVSDDLKVLGVADGVGGWGDLGVDPALYSRMIMAGAKYISDTTVRRDPQEIMSEAYEHAADVQGSSTCCVVMLDGFFLKTANLGDSGFIVIRGNTVVFRSKEQQHSFNFPYQLGTGSCDRPAHASRAVLTVQTGDLIIMGTDGLFDNLYDDEIVSIAGMSAEPAAVAQLLARRAFVVANSKTIISPFAKAARENGYPLAVGGKLDDITVLVARVVLNCDPNVMAA